MKQFPYLEVSGTHTDIGRAIGETFREKIKARLLWRKQHIPSYDKVRDASRPYFFVAQQSFPKLIEELEAVAAAAGVTVADYFFAATPEVYDDRQQWGRAYRSTHDRCTIAVSFNESGAIVGHNEDWTIESIDDLYILKAKADGITFLGLNYVTDLPGSAASINSAGLVQCINHLHQSPRVGIPKNFLSRAILELRSLEAAERLIKGTNRASGYNHVLVRNRAIRNIEISSSDIGIERISNAPWVHTNHFLSHNMRRYEKNRTQSSITRYARVRTLARANMTVVDMISLLSDRENTQFPICRIKETIGSLILLPQHREAYVCYGPPCEGQFSKYTV